MIKRSIQIIRLSLLLILCACSSIFEPEVEKIYIIPDWRVEFDGDSISVIIYTNDSTFVDTSFLIPRDTIYVEVYPKSSPFYMWMGAFISYDDEDRYYVGSWSIIELRDTLNSYTNVQYHSRIFGYIEVTDVTEVIAEDSSAYRQDWDPDSDEIILFDPSVGTGYCYMQIYPESLNYNIIEIRNWLSWLKTEEG